MPGPDAAAVSQGQTVALVMAAAGVAFLVVALALEALARPGRAGTRTRSALAGLLLMAAGLALVLVRRLDPAALSRVLDMAAAAFAAAVAEHGRRWPTHFGRLDDLHGRHLAVRCPHCSPRLLPEELS